MFGDKDAVKLYSNSRELAVDIDYQAEIYEEGVKGGIW